MLLALAGAKPTRNTATAAAPTAASATPSGKRAGVKRAAPKKGRAEQEEDGSEDEQPVASATEEEAAPEVAAAQEEATQAVADMNGSGSGTDGEAEAAPHAEEPASPAPKRAKLDPLPAKLSDIPGNEGMQLTSSTTSNAPRGAGQRDGWEAGKVRQRSGDSGSNRRLWINGLTHEEHAKVLLIKRIVREGKVARVRRSLCYCRAQGAADTARRAVYTRRLTAPPSAPDIPGGPSDTSSPKRGRQQRKADAALLF